MEGWHFRVFCKILYRLEVSFERHKQVITSTSYEHKRLSATKITFNTSKETPVISSATSSNRDTTWRNTTAHHQQTIHHRLKPRNYRHVSVVVVVVGMLMNQRGFSPLQPADGLPIAIDIDRDTVLQILTLH